jgi:hypothetical protein
MSLLLGNYGSDDEAGEEKHNGTPATATATATATAGAVTETATATTAQDVNESEKERKKKRKQERKEKKKNKKMKANHSPNGTLAERADEEEEEEEQPIFLSATNTKHSAPVIPLSIVAASTPRIFGGITIPLPQSTSSNSSSSKSKLPSALSLLSTAKLPKFLADGLAAKQAEAAAEKIYVNLPQAEPEPLNVMRERQQREEGAAQRKALEKLEDQREMNIKKIDRRVRKDKIATAKDPEAAAKEEAPVKGYRAPKVPGGVGPKESDAKRRAEVAKEYKKDTIKRKEKARREKGQCGLDTKEWKSDLQMKLRQQFDS